MKPRWDEVTKAVVKSLEAAIAIEQDKILMTQVNQEALKDEVLKRVSGEGDAEFAQRTLRGDQQKEVIDQEIAMRKKRLKIMMRLYTEFLNSQADIGEVAGPQKNLEELFREDTKD